MTHRIKKALTTAAENAVLRTPAGKLAKRVIKRAAKSQAQKARRKGQR